MTQGNFLLLLAIFVAKNTVYVLRNKIFRTWYYRKILKDPEHGYSYYHLRKIFYKTKKYSHVWYEIFERIIEVKGKYILENITRKDMRIPIKSFTEFFNTVEFYGIPDYFEIVIKQLELAIDSCNSTVKKEENILCMIDNLSELKSELNKLQKEYNLSAYNEINNLISSVDNALVKYELPVGITKKFGVLNKGISVINEAVLNMEERKQEASILNTEKVLVEN